MKNWMDGKQKHILIWALLLIYLFSANQIYVLYFLKNGKPDSTNVFVPAQTTGVIYIIADLQPVQINGESLYQLRGYAFDAANSLRKNTITIILSSRSQNLAFSTQAVPHPNMIESYPGFKSGMEGAEFSMLLSDDTLKPGTYQIGVLLEGQAGSSQNSGQKFVNTGSTIQKTPNTIRFHSGQ
jgi:hypothetical protein